MAKRSVRDAAASLVSQPPAGVTAALLDPPAAAAETGSENSSRPTPATRRARPATAAAAIIHHHGSLAPEEQGSNRQAELFYLQKQIQLQTQMVFILEDRTRVQGVIEWYDRNSIKVRGKSRMLIYKSAIKYLYKAGELGTNLD